MVIEGNCLFGWFFLWQWHCYIASGHCVGGCSLGDGSRGGSPRAEQDWLIPPPQPGSRAAGGQPGPAPAPGIRHVPEERDGPRRVQDVSLWVSPAQRGRWLGRAGLWWSRRPTPYGIAGDDVPGGTEMGSWEPGNAYGALRALTHSSFSLFRNDLATYMCWSRSLHPF